MYNSFCVDVLLLFSVLFGYCYGLETEFDNLTLNIMKNYNVREKSGHVHSTYTKYKMKASCARTTTQACYIEWIFRIVWKPEIHSLLLYDDDNENNNRRSKTTKSKYTHGASEYRRSCVLLQ